MNPNERLHLLEASPQTFLKAALIEIGGNSVQGDRPDRVPLTEREARLDHLCV